MSYLGIKDLASGCSHFRSLQLEYNETILDTYKLPIQAASPNTLVQLCWGVTCM